MIKRVALFSILLVFSGYSYSLTNLDVIRILQQHIEEEFHGEKLEKSVASGLWDSSKTLFVSSIDTGDKHVLVYAVSFYKGEEIFVNAGWYSGNILNEFRWAGAEEKDPREAVPVKIRDCSDSCLIDIRKRVWIKGQRYTKVRLLAIGRDGTIYEQ